MKKQFADFSDSANFVSYSFEIIGFNFAVVLVSYETAGLKSINSPEFIPFMPFSSLSVLTKPNCLCSIMIEV